MNTNFTRLFNKPYLLAFSALLWLSSCEVETITTTTDPVPAEHAAVTYTILKGQHNSHNALLFLDAALIRFEAIFDSSAIYTTVLPGNQADINKLYGLSDCGTNHHTNSARFGWRWYNGRLEIHAYTYHNKKRVTAYIGDVQIGQKNVYEIRLGEGGYTFKLNDKQLTLERNCSGNSSGYRLYPYFGGDETAPHTITIRVKDL